MKRPRPRAAAAGLVCVLSACATTGAKPEYLYKDSFAHYYVDASGRNLRVENDGTILDVSCFPLENVEGKPRSELPKVLCGNAENGVLGRARKKGGEWDMENYTGEDTGSCKPLFEAAALEPSDDGRRHSCWNRVWEVPAAIVVVPVAVCVVVGVATAAIWVPLVFFR